MDANCKEKMIETVLNSKPQKNSNDAWFLIEQLCKILEEYGYTDTDWWSEE